MVCVSNPGRIKKYLFSLKHTDRLRDSRFFLSDGPLVPFPGIKRQRRHIDHSPPSKPEVKYLWIYISNLLMFLYGVDT